MLMLKLYIICSEYCDVDRQTLTNRVRLAIHLVKEGRRFIPIFRRLKMLVVFGIVLALLSQSA